MPVLATVIVAVAAPRRTRNCRRPIPPTAGAPASAGSRRPASGFRRMYTALRPAPQPKNSNSSQRTTRVGSTSDPPIAILIAIIGRPNRAPIASPAVMLGCAPPSLRIPKKSAPATTPPPKNWAIAIACSAVLAESATLIPTRRIPSIIRSMPKVTTEPGRTRVIQSNRSNGTNGSPASSSAKYITPMSGPVRSAPTRAPIPRLSFLISAPHSFASPNGSGLLTGYRVQHRVAGPARLPPAVRVILSRSGQATAPFALSVLRPRQPVGSRPFDQIHLPWHVPQLPICPQIGKMARQRPTKSSWRRRCCDYDTNMDVSVG